VLTLLREEFPDVTISKIRFLESQGLVNPERSPSGYRKFFEPDVERLRWVLRQQREHFLPLKVIRDRLAAGDLGDDDDAASAVGSVQGNGVAVVPQPAHVGAGANVDPTARPTARGGGGEGASRSGPERGRTEAQLAKADNEAMARILADASRRTALIPEGGSDRAPLRVVPDPIPATGEREASRTHAPDSATAAATTADTASAATPAPSPPAVVSTAPPERTRRTSGPTPTAPPAPTVPPAPSAAAGPATPNVPGRDGPPVDGRGTAGAGPARAKGAAPTPRDSAGRGGTGGAGRPDGGGKAAGPGGAAGMGAVAKAGGTSSMVTGASFTAEELCAASGLAVEELSGLQGFGMIEPVMVAGILTFDEDALTVANLAADFRKFGIEPRHLRLYRNAVDREIGLIEQVIIPLLRQRNPESRERATQAADELGTLGQTMRATLLRAALRRHVGG
jgi:DNA-binding transcriptional MerR regulator